MSEVATTAAYRVIAAFENMKRANTPADNSLTTIDAWARVFPTAASGPRLVEPLGHLARSVRLVQSQIVSSVRLRPLAKASATAALTELSSLLITPILGQGFHNHAAKISPVNLGAVDAAGATLAFEYPERGMSDETASGFRDQLSSLLKDFKDANFPTDISIFMGEYIDALIWALENRDTMGSVVIRDMAASIGAALVEAKATVEHGLAAEGDETRLTLISRASSIATQVLVAVFKVDVAYHGVAAALLDAGKILIPTAQ